MAQADLVPVGNYSWLSEEELDRMEEEGEILSISATGPTGYILEVDLEYPQTLYAAHASMPLGPEKKEIAFTDLSPYAQESLVHLQGEKRAEKYSAEKLCSTLEDKKCYVVHYRNLQTYLTLGLRLKKIHRAIKFDQDARIAKFIRLCTEKRKSATTPTEKNIWKLCMNSTCGKFIQDNQRFFNVKFCTNVRAFNKAFTCTY